MASAAARSAARWRSSAEVSPSPDRPLSVLTSTTARSANGSWTPTEFSSGGSANATGVPMTAEIRSALMEAIFPDHFPKASRSIIGRRPGSYSYYMSYIVIGGWDGGPARPGTPPQGGGGDQCPAEPARRARRAEPPGGEAGRAQGPRPGLPGRHRPGRPDQPERAGRPGGGAPGHHDRDPEPARGGRLDHPGPFGQ